MICPTLNKDDNEEDDPWDLLDNRTGDKLSGNIIRKIVFPQAPSNFL